MKQSTILRVGLPVLIAVILLAFPTDAQVAGPRWEIDGSPQPYVATVNAPAGSTYSSSTSTLTIAGGGGGSVADYGDGSSGAATIAAGTTTLTDDAFYTTLSVTGLLVTSSDRVFANVSITGTGAILNEGKNTTAQSGATGLPSGTLGGSGAGGSGGNETAGGAAGGSTTSSFGGSGTAGENGSGGAGGAAGTATAPANSLGKPSAPPVCYGRLFDASLFTGGAGGGGGGGGALGDGPGGGGGSGGGPMVVAAPSIDLSSGLLISSRGGNGFNPGSPTAGAGGGSGGGDIVLIGHVTCGTAGLIDDSGGVMYLDGTTVGVARGTAGHVYILGQTDCNVVPGVPVLSGSSPGAGQMTLSWTTSGHAAFGYVSELDNVDCTFAHIIKTAYAQRKTTTFTAGGLATGSYCTRIYAENIAGQSAWSNSVTIHVN